MYELISSSVSPFFVPRPYRRSNADMPSVNNHFPRVARFLRANLVTPKEVSSAASYRRENESIVFPIPGTIPRLTGIYSFHRNVTLTAILSIVESRFLRTLSHRTPGKIEEKSGREHSARARARRVTVAPRVPRAVDVNPEIPSD